MITEIKDKDTGIYRFELNTVNAGACRKEIEKSGFVKYKDGVADSISYLVMFGQCEIEIRTTPTRTVLFGKTRYAMLEYLEQIKGDESSGTAWIYDDSKRTDYAR